MPIVIDDSKLVAYLDGELPDDEVSTVDAELSRDDGLRERLHKLQATWNLLGELPDETPNSDLAQSTIEMVTLALESEDSTWWARFKRQRLLVVGLVLLLTVLVGAVAGKSLASLMEGKFLAELPALVLMPALDNIDSPQWLDRLAAIPNLVEAGDFLINERGAGSGQMQIDASIPHSMRERDAWVERLEEPDQGRLAESWKEFTKLPPSKQVEIQEVAKHLLESDDRSDELLMAIQAYQALLHDLNTPYLTLLNEQPPDKRALTVEQLVAGVMCQKYSMVISQEDKTAIEFWISDLQFQENLFMMSFEEFGERVIEELSMSDDPEGSFINITEETIAMLFEGDRRLSPEATQYLSGVVDTGDRRRYLGLWVLSVFGRSAEQDTAATPEELQEAFGSLKPADKHKVELMPEAQARDELERRLRAPVRSSSPTGT